MGLRSSPLHEERARLYVPKGQTTIVAAAIRQVFLQPDHAAATQTWRQVADQLRARWPKLGICLDEAEQDVLAYMTPELHRSKLHSTNRSSGTAAGDPGPRPFSSSAFATPPWTPTASPYPQLAVTTASDYVQLTATCTPSAVGTKLNVQVEVVGGDRACGTALSLFGSEVP